MDMKKLLTTIALVAPFASFADGRGYSSDPTVDVSGFAGANFQSITDGFDTSEPEGHDLGVRGKVFLGSGLFIAGEYTYADVDEQFSGSRLRYQLDEYRLGGGVLLPISPQFKFGGYGHYVNQQVDTSYLGSTVSGEADGYDIGALAQFDASPRVQTYGRLGYMSLEPVSNGGGSNRADGVDLLVGLSYKLSREMSLFGEYRYTNLQDDVAESEYSSVRGGVRLQF